MCSQLFGLYNSPAATAQVMYGWFHTLYVILDVLRTTGHLWFIQAVLVDNRLQRFAYAKG